MLSECQRVWPAARFENVLQGETGMGGVGSSFSSSTVAGELGDVNACVFKYTLAPLACCSIWDNLMQFDIADEQLWIGTSQIFSLD